MPIWHNRPAWIKKHYMEFCKAEIFKYYCISTWISWNFQKMFTPCQKFRENVSSIFLRLYVLIIQISHIRYLNYEIIAFWFCNVKQKKYDKYRIDKYIDGRPIIIIILFFSEFFSIFGISEKFRQTEKRRSNEKFPTRKIEMCKYKV